MPSNLDPPHRKPKSSRQQFSACGACRMRRVRCDLKDHYDNALAAGIPPSCSNCRERSLKCVDEYADIKTVKLLRRGRRLQQVEAVYGSPSLSDPKSPLSPTSPSLSLASPTAGIPTLNPAFFQSDFFRRFHIQRPIVDPEEFRARYVAYYDGNDQALGPPGRLIAILLVVWAASYGVDESGREQPHTGYHGIYRQKTLCNDMVKDVLRFIDLNGILRKPTWDGVRALLLLMPLTEEVQSPLDRLVMYELAISQVYTLCSFEPVSFNEAQTEHGSALAKARIFWYAYVHEGITSSLRGGRLHLSHDDLEAFQDTLPPMESSDNMSSSAHRYNFAYRFAVAPIQLASACRQVHACLTGPKARRKSDIDSLQLESVWEEFDRCWDSFEQFRESELPSNMKDEDSDRFVSGWQIFIFECQNIIREALKQRIIAINASSDAHEHHADSNDSSVYRQKIERLHAIAETKCVANIRHVVALVRRHLATTFFEYDASLTRDGVFFASFLLAEGHGPEEDLHVCVSALREFRWAFSKSEEREQTLDMVMQSRSRGSGYPSRTPREMSNSPNSSNDSLASQVRHSPNSVMQTEVGGRHNSPISVDSMHSIRNVSRSSDIRRSPHLEASRVSGEIAASGMATSSETSSSLSIVTRFPSLGIPYNTEDVDSQHRFLSSVPPTSASEGPSSAHPRGDANNAFYGSGTTTYKPDEQTQGSSSSSSSYGMYSQYGGSSDYYLQ